MWKIKGYVVWFFFNTYSELIKIGKTLNIVVALIESALNRQGIY